ASLRASTNTGDGRKRTRASRTSRRKRRWRTSVKPRKILVTGGNGHVGNTLAKRLHDKGYEVRVTVRNPDEAKAFGIFDGYSVEVHRADMRDEAAMRKAMDGVDGVFQVAALYHYDEQGVGEGIVDNNVEGAQSVLRLASECSVERVVLTS